MKLHIVEATKRIFNRHGAGEVALVDGHVCDAVPNAVGKVDKARRVGAGIFESKQRIGAQIAGGEADVEVLLDGRVVNSDGAVNVERAGREHNVKRGDANEGAVKVGVVVEFGVEVASYMGVFVAKTEVEAGIFYKDGVADS